MSCKVSGVSKQGKYKKNLNSLYLILLILILETILGVSFVVNPIPLWTGVSEIFVAGLMIVAASQSHSTKIKTFLYVGVAILGVLAGYQIINAFG